jgi:hypothetical protein
MKSCSPALLDAIPTPKTISARMTFRVERPRFATTSIANTMNITDPAKIDSCAYGTGILRVTNYNNILYYQNVQDVYGAWPAWVNSGISLFAGHTPAVDNGYVWYQKPDDKLYYRSFANWSNEVPVFNGPVTNGTAACLAPVSNKRCYRMTYFAGSTRIRWCDTSGRSGMFPVLPHSTNGTLFTYSHIDAVSIDASTDYIYIDDRAAGHVVETRASFSDPANPVIGKLRPIVSMDAVDDMYGLKMHGASVINGKVVVTGWLTRTSDGDPVSMDVYLVGPENFTFGREMFISGTYVGGKMLLVGSSLVVPGMNHYADAVGTNLFGVDNEALKLVTSDVGNLQLTEAQNRSSVLRTTLSSSLSHAAISKGSSVTLEVAYNDQWMTVFTGEINRVVKGTNIGSDLSVEMQNKTAKRLSQWSPEQGIYIPSQSFNVADASDLTQAIWTTANLTADVSSPGSFSYTDAQWTYSGPGWVMDPANNRAWAYASDTSVFAKFTFCGTQIIFNTSKGPDRAVWDFWIDGAVVATVNGYNAVGISYQWTSGVLPYGDHVLMISRNISTVGSKTLIVSGATVVDTFLNGRAVMPKRLNDLAVLYTASRATPGGLMRARFWNEGVDDTSVRNPRFGVGINYNRETKADAATRLGVEYNDVEDTQCGHNGLVAIYSRLEVGNAPGIALYEWKNSVMTLRASWPVTLPKGCRVWLQIRSIDDEVIVSWRQDGNASWHTLSAYSYDQNPPWDPEVGGHGCVVMEKKSMISSTCYTLSSQDTTLGVVDNGYFPASGQVVIDDEIISYSAKKGYVFAANPDFGVRFGGSVKPDAAFTSGERIIIQDNNVQMLIGSPLFQTDNCSNIMGMAVCPFTKSSDTAAARSSLVFDRTFRIVGYDWAIPNMWKPSGSYNSAGWSIYTGDGAYGSWVTFQGTNLEKGLYLSPSGVGIPVSDTEYDAAPIEHYVRLLPAFYITKRGDNGTSVVTHGASKVINYVPINLWADRIEFFSTDEDITIGDALNKIVRLTGGGFKDSALVDSKVVFSPGAYWCGVPFSPPPDFIVDVIIPANLPADTLVGVALQCPTPINQSMYNALYVYLAGGDLWLSRLTEQYEAIESIPSVTSSAGRTGTLRVSVQDDRISVWLDHRLLHVFINPYAANPYGSYAGVAVANSAMGSGPDVPCRVSELCDLMADITVGVRGNGMSVIGEMLDGRRVNFRCEPDGSLYFYKSNTDAGTLPDIVISDEKSDTDEAISRVRVEGISVAEIADFGLLSDIGNLFGTVNSKWADSVPGLVLDGQYYLAKAKSEAVTHQMQTVLHPAIQPGDKAKLNIAGQLTDIHVMSTSVSFGFDGDNFNIQANLEVCE